MRNVTAIRIAYMDANRAISTFKMGALTMAYGLYAGEDIVFNFLVVTNSH